MIRTLAISLALLLGALSPAALAIADEIASTTDAEALCHTAAPHPPVVGEGTGHRDPLLSAHRHREYSVERYSRVTDVYSVLLDTNEFGFVPSEPGMLTISSWEAYPLFGGAFELDLGNAPDPTFMVSDEARETIQAGVASDQVQLRLFFHLLTLDNPELPYCELTESGVVRILGRLLAANLVRRQDDEVVAHAETDRYQWSRVRFGIETPGDYEPPQPTVAVTNTSFSRPDVPSTTADALAAEAEARMMPCYLRGLNQNGRLQGAMVVSMDVDEAGAVNELAVTIDAIDQPVVTGCVVGALDDLAMPGGPVRGFRVRMTVIFRLE